MTRYVSLRLSTIQPSGAAQGRFQKKRVSRPRGSGFTLIELAVVIAIVGLLLGGLLVPLANQVDRDRVDATRKQLSDIEETLIGFAMANGRLPCPDTDGDGQEDAGCGNTTEGDLPWATLGVERQDAWGHPFRYRVDSAFAVAIVFPGDTVDGLAVQDRTTPTPVPLTVGNPNAAAAIIFSCGKDGIPNAENDDDGTANASANCTNSNTAGNLIYTQDVFTEAVFDDMLIWLSKNTLVGRLVTSGVWP